MATVFVPEKLIVGFNNRHDSFTSKLGFITYLDKAGKHCQEKSMEGWRDKKIPLEHIENTPVSGFVFNRGITRSGYFRSNGDKVRIWDPRDFEIEIPLSNFLGILACCDSSKREIIGEMVYGWENGRLLLLPVDSQEYEDAMAETRQLDAKVKATDLKYGQWYGIKKQEHTAVYIGKGTTNNEMDYKKNTLKNKKGHVFWIPETNVFTCLTPDKLGILKEETHPELEEAVQRYHTSEHMASATPNIRFKKFEEVKQLVQLHFADHHSSRLLELRFVIDNVSGDINIYDYSQADHQLESSINCYLSLNYEYPKMADEITYEEMRLRRSAYASALRQKHGEDLEQFRLNLINRLDGLAKAGASIREIQDAALDFVIQSPLEFKTPVFVSDDGKELYISDKLYF